MEIPLFNTYNGYQTNIWNNSSYMLSYKGSRRKHYLKVSSHKVPINIDAEQLSISVKGNIDKERCIDDVVQLLTYKEI